MKIFKFNLVFVSSVVALALSVLVYIQYSILKKDLETNMSKMEFAIPRILLDTYGELTFVGKLDAFMSVYQGTEEFSFNKESNPVHPIQGIIKDQIDRVLDLNYPELDYTVNGFISNEYQCLIHSHHNADLPMAQTVIKAENNICLCTLTPNTLDISLSYSNKRATVLGDSWIVVTLSFFLILIVTGAFAFTIYTINKQKKLSELKKDFINNLTHEFKTPIFSISLAAKSLMESKAIASSKKLGNYTELITNESRRLKNQVDKIMQMALADSGNLTLEKNRLIFMS